jgi:PiT family inorganic phosphate transporter
MGLETIVAVVAVVFALGFDFVNGFHDTANAVATVIYTKALKPGVAIAMSGMLNFLGALLVGTAVAQQITRIIPSDTVSLPMVIAVLLAALSWNLLTWWFGIPVSSSHCLIASLFGVGVTAAGMRGVHWGELQRVVSALLISPVLGFFAGGLLTYITLKISAKESTNVPVMTDGTTQASVRESSRLMRFLHVLASGLVSFSHGSNDGQKTMGIIMLVLASHFAGYTTRVVPLWVVAMAATALSAGTVVGGWRVIKTVGTKISQEKMNHTQGFCACMSTALIILLASESSVPISTTQTLSSAVAGGTIPAFGKDKLNGKTIKALASAWILTIPVAAALASSAYYVLRVVWHP